MRRDAPQHTLRVQLVGLGIRFLCGIRSLRRLLHGFDELHLTEDLAPISADVVNRGGRRELVGHGRMQRRGL